MGMFAAQVWAKLRRIPRGCVATYGGVAAAIGNPRAVRAVAQACARNPNPITTPCHRVVASDGALGGYSGPGGVRRKAELLRQEGHAIHRGHIQQFSRVRYDRELYRRTRWGIGISAKLPIRASVTLFGCAAFLEPRKSAALPSVLRRGLRPPGSSASLLLDIASPASAARGAK